MVVVLIILNILLIILLTILSLYIIKSNKCDDNSVCIKDDEIKRNENSEIVEVNNEQKNNLTSEKVFNGIFITDEKYQQMMKNRRSDISILIEDLYNEYEHLKELNK
jgi:uncharacterized protein YxeA